MTKSSHTPTHTHAQNDKMLTHAYTHTRILKHTFAHLAHLPPYSHAHVCFQNVPRERGKKKEKKREEKRNEGRAKAESVGKDSGDKRMDGGAQQVGAESVGARTSVDYGMCSLLSRHRADEQPPH